MSRGKFRQLAALVAVGALGLGLTACVAPEDAPAGEGESYILTPDTVPNDKDAPVVVWSDAVRQEGLEAYKAANPDVKIDVQIIAIDQMLAKIQLANRAEKGWPDVVFTSDSALAALASTQYENFAQPLDGLVDEKKLDGFGSSLDPCTIGGSLYCLRNDIAPDVMYYSTEGFDEIGAEVPTTFEELGELAENLAANHPDYKIQLHGSDYRAYFHFYNASNCPYVTPEGANDLIVDMSDPRCVRASELLDTLVSTGVLVTDALSADQLKAMGSKMLLSLNAVWRAGSVADMLGYAPGTLGVAQVPVWEGDEENSRTGNEGGGSWAVSRHALNMRGALDLAEYMSTDSTWLNSTITFPAYEPAQQEWLDKNLPAITSLADPEEAAAVFKDSAARLGTIVPWLRFTPNTEFPVQEVQAGESITDKVAESFVNRLINAGTAAGYRVSVAE